MFLIMVNNVPNDIENPIFMYAHDIKNLANSQEILEDIMCRMSSWSEFIKLSLIREKCTVLPLKGESSTPLTDDFESVIVQKDLGIYLLIPLNVERTSCCQIQESNEKVF